jgi:DNA-binding PadR family transcriptional regulator
MAQLVAMLEDAGLVEVYVDDQGRETYRLTEDGVRVGHMLAMVEGEDADKVLEALLAGSAQGR